jgi:ATP/maltotriose-dependent transcriptional regulator MalT
MFATCRTHYADLLVWRGDWREAEQALTAACRDLAGVPRKVVDGVVRLAEVRRRQGRLDQAEAPLAEADAHRLSLLVRSALRLDPGEPLAAAEAHAHRLSLLERSALRLDPGEPLAAAEEADRFLRRVGESDRFERVPALELVVRARVQLGNASGARRAVAELERTAADVGTAPLRAAARLARGRLSAATQNEAARSAFEDAVDLFVECGARYEAGQARLELAQLLRALGRDDDATAVEAVARETLAGIGASVPAPAAERGLLTAREREVVRLLAQGRSNDAIASELVVSVRTVERHVESIYKIGVSGRTARAAATGWALAHGFG